MNKGIERLKPCDDTSDWLLHTMGAARSVLAAARGDQRHLVQQHHTRSSSGEALFNAMVAGDLDTGLRIVGAQEDNEGRVALLLSTIDRLDAAWRNDDHHIITIAEAFWTLRRLLSRDLSGGILRRKRNPSRASLLLVVPQGEDHSFGAQLLADRLTETGCMVELCFGTAPPQVLERLSETGFDAFGLSIGYDRSLLGLADLISEARIRSANPALNVILGGSAFDPDLRQYSFLGADRILTDLESSVEFMTSLPTLAQRDKGIRHDH